MIHFFANAVGGAAEKLNDLRLEGKGLVPYPLKETRDFHICVALSGLSLNLLYSPGAHAPGSSVRPFQGRSQSTFDPLVSRRRHNPTGHRRHREAVEQVSPGRKPWDI